MLVYAKAINGQYFVGPTYSTSRPIDFVRKKIKKFNLLTSRPPKRCSHSTKSDVQIKPASKDLDFVKL